MTTPAINSQLATIARATTTASPYTYTAIPGVTSIQLGGPSRGEIDVTDLDSPAKEFLMGLKDSGQLSLDVNFNPDNSVHTLLRSDIDSTSPRRFRLTFRDTSPYTTYTFEAFVMGMPITMGVDQAVKATVTLRITGDITVA